MSPDSAAGGFSRRVETFRDPVDGTSGGIQVWYYNLVGSCLRVLLSDGPNWLIGWWVCAGTDTDATTVNRNIITDA